MSKATSINNLNNVDMNVSQEINNVLAEIESSRNNEQQQQHQQQHQQSQQLPQMIQQMPPMQGQQMPPPQQVPPQYAQQMQQQQQMQQNPNYYKNFPTQPESGGIMDFMKGFMIVGDEFKLVGLIAGLFFIMSMSQTRNMLGKYLKFTINDLGDSTMVGLVTRGLIVGLVFVVVNKFI